MSYATADKCATGMHRYSSQQLPARRERTQLDKACIDLRLLAPGRPMQLIIDLGAIIERLVRNKENICSQRDSPPSRLNKRKSFQL